MIVTDLKSRSMENKFIICKNCPFFKSGHCRITLYGCSEHDICRFSDFDTDLDKRQAMKVLSYFQKWRRGGDGLQPNSHLLGLALDEAIRSLRKEIKK